MKTHATYKATEKEIRLYAPAGEFKSPRTYPDETFVSLDEEEAQALLETLTGALREARTRPLLTLEQAHTVMDVVRDGEEKGLLYGDVRALLLELRVPREPEA